MNWSKGTINAISEQLHKEPPEPRGFSAKNIKNMCTFFEEWHMIEQHNSAVTTAEITKINTSDNSVVQTTEIAEDVNL